MRFERGGLEEVMINIDVNNTINGGMVESTVSIENYTDEYIVDIKIPSVSEGKLRLRLVNRVLVVLQALDYDVKMSGYVLPVTHVLQKIPLPQLANSNNIDAVHKGNRLLIFIPKGHNPAEKSDNMEIDIK